MKRNLSNYRWRNWKKDFDEKAKEGEEMKGVTPHCLPRIYHLRPKPKKRLWKNKDLAGSNMKNSLR